MGGIGFLARKLRSGRRRDDDRDRAMRLVPKDITGAIQFFQTHGQTWAQDPGGIGTTPEYVAELQARLEAARAALREQQQLQNAARSATLRLRLAMEAVKQTGTAIIHQVRAKALSGGEAIYPKAALPLPRKGSPIGAPGTPYSLKTTLLPMGELVLRWKCDNPRGSVGTMYQVWRSVLGEGGAMGPWAFVGAVGEKSIRDQSVPAGASMLLYRIKAMRSKKTGREAMFPVRLGVRRAAAAQMPPMQVAA